MSAATVCTPLPNRGIYRGENARNDVCQVQVRVDTPGGVSAPTTIRPPLEGALRTNALGVFLSGDCRCEVAQTADEFDYLPRPRIDSVSTAGGPGTLASEHGGSVITVKGVGLNPLDIDWADFGDPALDSSVQIGYVFLSGTEMQITAPRREVTLGIARVPFSVRTLAGQSNAKPVRYAGLPAASKVISLSSAVTVGGLSGASTIGGTPIEVQGQHFTGQVLALRIVGLNPAEGSGGTQYNFTVTGDTALRTRTVSQNPGIVAVEPCTASGCAKGSLAAGLVLYPPGSPSVTAVSPSRGRRPAGPDHDHRTQSRLPVARVARLHPRDQRRRYQLAARLRLDDDGHGRDPRGRAGRNGAGHRADGAERVHRPRRHNVCDLQLPLSAHRAVLGSEADTFSKGPAHDNSRFRLGHI